MGSPRRHKDANQFAKYVLDVVTGEVAKENPPVKKAKNTRKAKPRRKS